MPETAGSGRRVVTEDQAGQLPRVNPRVASIARICDYWLGGKDNFEADRAAGTQ